MVGTYLRLSLVDGELGFGGWTCAGKRRKEKIKKSGNELLMKVSVWSRRGRICLGGVIGQPQETRRARRANAPC